MSKTGIFSTAIRSQPLGSARCVGKWGADAFLVLDSIRYIVLDSIR